MANDNLTEKVSVNINSSTLAQIDLLVDNGYYSNRSDFINQALRSALHQEKGTLDRIIDKNSQRNSWFVGVSGFTALEIDKLYDQGKTMDILGYGVLVVDDNVNEEKLFQVVRSIRLKGRFVGSPSVRAHYGLK